MKNPLVTPEWKDFVNSKLAEKGFRLTTSIMNPMDEAQECIHVVVEKLNGKKCNRPLLIAIESIQEPSSEDGGGIQGGMGPSDKGI